MIGFLFIGILIGGGLGFTAWWHARREQTRLDEEKQMLEQEKMIVLDCMHTMVEAIAQGKSKQELHREIVSAAVRSTGAGAACIFEQHEEVLRAVAVEGLFPPHRPLSEAFKDKPGARTRMIEQVLRAESFAMGEGLVGECARTGKARLVADARQDPTIVKHDDLALEVRSVIVASIRFREQSVGVLAVVNPIDGGPFGEMDLSLVESLGEQAALALHNLDAMEVQIEQNKLQLDLSLANEIQGLLLPKSLPHERDLDVGAIYEPALAVGGDLYDVFTLDKTRTAVVVADVSGKGVPASIVMALCQSNLRHLAHRHDSPADVMRALNAILSEEMKRNMFVTMLYAVIDTAKNQLTLCRAGHESPLLVHAANGKPPAFELLNGPGMAVGLMPSRIFDRAVADAVFSFCPGDSLSIFTDGLTETRNAGGEEFGATRLGEAALGHSLGGADALNSHLVQALAQFAGGRDRIEDDITLLTVQRPLQS